MTTTALRSTVDASIERLGIEYFVGFDRIRRAMRTARAAWEDADPEAGCHDHLLLGTVAFALDVLQYSGYPPQVWNLCSAVRAVVKLSARSFDG